MSKSGEDAMAAWPSALRQEFEANRFNPCVGQVLLSETPRVRVWSLSLQPGARLPFHRHQLEYMIHDLENIGDTVLAYTTVEFMDSANPPLPAPDAARRKAA